MVVVVVGDGPGSSYGQERKAGEEWLVTRSQTEVHIPDVYEEVVGTVAITSLTNRQYWYLYQSFLMSLWSDERIDHPFPHSVVLNPTKNGVSQLGSRELRRGPLNFFLQPGEAIEKNAISEGMHVPHIYLVPSLFCLIALTHESFSFRVGGGGRPADEGSRGL